MMTREDAYRVLRVPADVDEAGVVAAHRQLVLRWHPDLHPSDDQKQIAEERLKSINQARDLLLDLVRNAPASPESDEKRDPPPPQPRAPYEPTITPIPAHDSLWPKLAMGLVGALFLAFVVLLAIREEDPPTRRGRPAIKLNADAPTILNMGDARILDPKELE